MLKYEANVRGEIFRNGKLCKQGLHHTGYLCVSIRNKQWRAHRFVWFYFNGDVPEGMCINHKDGVKTNNSLDNLECVTFQENIQHAYRMGLMKGAKGEDNSMAKLENNSAIELFKLLPSMNNTEIGQMFNLHPRYVSLIRHKRRWKALWAEYEGSETMAGASRSQA